VIIVVVDLEELMKLTIDRFFVERLKSP
jgi:hypothetical protein